MAFKKVIISRIAEEEIGRYFEKYLFYGYRTDMPVRAFNYSRMRSILTNIEACFDDIYIINGKKYIDLEGIGTVEFSMEDNQSEILIKNVYFKNP